MSEYVIKSAYYANPEKSAVIIQTEGFGDVIVSEPDRPELWAEVMDWVKVGGKIEDKRPGSGPDVD